jgi:hypothetical protein
MNRGAMEASDVQRGIAESNLRNEYQDVALLLARRLLTPHEYVEAQIRGYIDEDARRAGTRLHGMTDADSDLLFLNSGRPLVAHQITTGLARGAKFEPLPGELTDPYDAAVHESSVHPSYYEIWKANKYTYPPLFQLTNLVKANAISADVAADWATKNGLAPEVVTAMHTFWAGSSSTTTAKKKLSNATIRSSWKKGNISEAEALADIEANGLSAEDARIFLYATTKTS